MELALRASFFIEKHALCIWYPGRDRAYTIAQKAAATPCRISGLGLKPKAIGLVGPKRPKVRTRRATRTPTSAIVDISYCGATR